MNNCVLFTIPGNESMGHLLLDMLDVQPGEVLIKRFPDGETYVKVMSDVHEKEVIIACSLHHPDTKILPLYYLAKTLKEFRASSITLVAPYLAYMRQDKRFTEGECITSALFAKLLSSFIDRLITIDPHLHRHSSLDELYSIHTSVLHAAPLIAGWIRENIGLPVIIGPDSESEQWIREVAGLAEAPYVLLEKTRISDKKVQISFPAVEKYLQHTPVLVDDIISTASTMSETIRLLAAAGLRSPVCVGIHAVMAGGAYDKLIKAGAARIVTTNSIIHPSNAIHVERMLATAVSKNCFCN